MVMNIPTAAPKLRYDLQRHESQFVFITGAGSGIGRETVIRYAHEGAAGIVGVDIREERILETQKIVQESGFNNIFTPLTGDISKHRDVDNMVKTAIEKMGRIDVLANIAGIQPDGFANILDINDEDWDASFFINVKGTMMMCRAVLPGMLERKSGSIINMSSEAGLRGGISGIAYTASKHAIIGLTKNIAWIYRTEGVRCNAVCPGGVDTNMNKEGEIKGEGFNQLLPLLLAINAELVHPDRIAALVSWLGSEESANVTGAIIANDGGMAAG
jgi:NAD(P)-dependent dehydrogenase (short-subunit alcohol dehydrogenase family)